MLNPRERAINNNARTAHISEDVEPSSVIQDTAFALDLSHLKQDNEGQWQASDRYGNRYTITPRLVQSVLGKLDRFDSLAVLDSSPKPLRPELAVAC